MFEFCPQIKWVHIACVLASGTLFALRGLLVQAGHAGAAQWTPVRWLSYAIDTTLLTAALMLVSILPGALFANGWITTKLVLLVAYVVLALCALVLLYWCAQVVISNYQSGARSNSSLAVPLAIPQAIWLVGLAWFALLAVLYALYGLAKCVRGRPEEAYRRLGVASLEEEIEASVSREAQP